MNPLKIIASIEAKKEFEEEVLQALYAVTDGTRLEPGNLAYDLHRDIHNPFKYVLIEIWNSSESIAFHNQTQHYKTFKSAIEGKIEKIDVVTVEKIY